MPILKPTQFTARITYLGRVQTSAPMLWSEPADTLTATFAGIDGEVHAGITVPSCSRMTAQYPEATTIANTRQLSILSAEELQLIATAMGLPSLSPSLLGVTMLLDGIPDFSHIPPGSRLQAASGATIVVNLNNRPCTVPLKAIEAAHPGYGAKFKPAANGLRGIVAWVERQGPLHLGDTVRLHIPDQRPWAHL